jgi:hypothetical protein
VADLIPDAGRAGNKEDQKQENVFFKRHKWQVLLLERLN